MFEITGDDIALLDDEQLRAVVARLCETELRSRGYSAAYVTWGGNQTAVDGGIDARVELPPGSVTDRFIPRPATGFQVTRRSSRWDAKSFSYSNSGGTIGKITAWAL